MIYFVDCFCGANYNPPFTRFEAASDEEAILKFEKIFPAHHLLYRESEENGTLKTLAKRNVKLVDDEWVLF